MRDLTDQHTQDIFSVGHAAAKSAADHADREIPLWTIRAGAHFRHFAVMVKRPFLTEEARKHAEALGLPIPPDGRAWGHVAKAAQRNGVVVSAGFAAAQSSNGSPKVLWRAANGKD